MAQNNKGAGPYTGYSRNFRAVKPKRGQVSSGVTARDVLGWMKNNPGEATRLVSDALGFTPPFMRKKPTAAELKQDAAFAAMSLIPVPGLGQGAKAAAKITTRAAGKTGRAVAADAAKAASRRTAAESATIRRGTAAGRTADKAAQLEKQAAKESASNSVNTGQRSPVAPRPSAAQSGQVKPPNVPKDAIDKFVKGRKFGKPKQAKADLEEMLRAGARARAEGRPPGSDVPYRDGSTPLGNPTGVTPARTPKPRTPKPTAQDQKADAFARGLTKPKNPGAKASAAAKEKYQKDLAAFEARKAQMANKTKQIDEGRLKADGTPKGATAKSISRNQRNQAKKAGAEGPKKPASAPPVKPKSSAGAEGPKGKALAVRPSKVATTPKAASKSQREAIDMKTRPVGGASGSRVLGAGRPRLAIEGPKQSVKRGGKKKFLAAGAVAAGALGLAGYQFDKKNNPDNKPAAAKDEKPLKKFGPTEAYLDASTGRKAGPGQSKASESVRKEQNKDVADGTLRKSKGGKYMRRYNSKTGRWDIVSATKKTASKFQKDRKKALRDRTKG
jgi:hypothetical protein